MAKTLLRRVLQKVSPPSLPLPLGASGTATTSDNNNKI